MPIYEYRCESCEHEFETIQKMSDNPLVECPECKQPTLKKLISAAAFRLKGAGWYETDFKRDNKRNLSAEDGAKSSAEDKSVSKDTPSKESTKSEDKSAKQASKTDSKKPSSQGNSKSKE